MVLTAVAIIAVGLLVFTAHLFSILFERTRVPDVLPLLLIGIIIGPVFRLVLPETLGQVGGIFATVTLIVILFESGLGLNFSTLGRAGLAGLRLTTINFLVSLGVTGLLGRGLFGMNWLEALLLGAITGGTSSAVVIPMVSRLRLQPDTRTTLLLESALSDVLCIVGAMALLRAAQSPNALTWTLGLRILLTFLLAAAIGGAFALVWSALLLRLRRLENSIFLTPAFVFVIYGVTELLGYNGAIAALTFGIMLGNIPTVRNAIPVVGRSLQPAELTQRERQFFSEVAFLLKTFFFVYIGLSLRFSNLVLLAAGLGITLAQFLVRIPVVRLAFSRRTPGSDAAIAAVTVPKGLAAAVLAAMPKEAGLASGALIQDVVYAVIMFSIILTAVLDFLCEKGILRQPYRWAFRGYALPGAAPTAPPADN